jgi:hypothetical protein
MTNAKGKKMATKRGLLVLHTILLIFGITIITSCTTFTASGLQRGITPGSSSGYEVLGSFTEREWVNKFFGSSAGTNLFNITSHATDGVVERAITKNLRKFGGTGVINLEITYLSNPAQWFLNAITLHFWAPSTVVVKGTIIRQ